MMALLDEATSTDDNDSQIFGGCAFRFLIRRRKHVVNEDVFLPLELDDQRFFHAAHLDAVPSVVITSWK